MSKCPVTGNHCDVEKEFIEPFEKARHEAECLRSHYEKDVRELMEASKQLRDVIKVRAPRIGQDLIYKIALEASVDRVDQALDTLYSYDESDDPRENGWVGQDGLP